ncbi:hypothetical protein J6590_010125 [Homalodisca vitripennis]|nr:hypothetical protein J6590_010125 [Homalodisca vitripennis]
MTVTGMVVTGRTSPLYYMFDHLGSWTTGGRQQCELHYNSDYRRPTAVRATLQQWTTGDRQQCELHYNSRLRRPACELHYNSGLPETDSSASYITIVDYRRPTAVRATLE